MASPEDNAASSAGLGSNVIPFRRRPQTHVGCYEHNFGTLPDPDADPESYKREWLAICLRAAEAKAERDYIEARWSRERFTDPESAKLTQLERGPAFDRMRVFVGLVAALPVPIESRVSYTRNNINRKRRIIGSVWLRSEGERYDAYRASIAADEARLGLR